MVSKNWTTLKLFTKNERFFRSIIGFIYNFAVKTGESSRKCEQKRRHCTVSVFVYQTINSVSIVRTFHITNFAAPSTNWMGKRRKIFWVAIGWWQQRVTENSQIIHFLKNRKISVKLNRKFGKKSLCTFHRPNSFSRTDGVARNWVKSDKLSIGSTWECPTNGYHINTKQIW